MSKDFDLLIASGAPATVASSLASLHPAEQARLQLNELTDYLAFEFSKTTSLGYRIRRSVLVRLVAACATWPDELDVTFPWSFSDAGEYGVGGWESAPDAPKQPENTAIAAVAQGYVNLSCAQVEHYRSGNGLPDSAVAYELWRWDGSAFEYVKNGTIAGDLVAFQDGPFPAGTGVSYVIKTAVSGGNGLERSYPTAFLSATATA